MIAFAIGQVFGRNDRHFLFSSRFVKKDEELKDSEKQDEGKLHIESGKVTVPTKTSSESARKVSSFQPGAAAKVFSALSSKTSKMALPWQANVDPRRDIAKTDETLIESLQKICKFRVRRSKHSSSSVSLENSASQAAAAESETYQLSEQRMGAFGNAEADTLDDVLVVEPLLKLRGMDVFLTDNPEPECCTHPFLLEQGLRDYPTFTLNILSQWGNVLIYFTLPRWVCDFEDIQEEDDDPDDVKALKVRIDHRVHN
jgi:hypothetical protein